MKKNIVLWLMVILLCTASGLAQSRRKQSDSLKPVAVKMPEDLVQKMIRENKEVRRCLAEQGGNVKKFIAESLSAEEFDLNSDGKPELLVTGGFPCLGGMRWFSFWIYSKTDGRWNLLYEGGVGEGGYKIESTLTKGYRDISTGAGSATYFDSSIYKFDGRGYRECVSKHYEPNQRGRMILKSIKKKC